MSPSSSSSSSSNAKLPVADKRVVGEIMGAVLTAITLGALEPDDVPATA